MKGNKIVMVNVNKDIEISYIIDRVASYLADNAKSENEPCPVIFDEGSPEQENLEVLYYETLANMMH